MTRLSLALTLVAAGLGALVLPDNRPGLGLAVVGLLVLGAAAGARPRLDWTALALGLAAAALVACVVLRSATWLIAGDLVAAFAFASLAMAGGRTWAAQLRGLGGAWVRLPVGLGTVGAAIARYAPRTGNARVGPAVRGVALALVLVGVFGALFASGDPAFAHLAGELVPADVGLGTLGDRALIFVLLVAAGGALVAVAGRGSGLAESKPARRGLGATEWKIALGALDALFAVFVAVQLRVLFGGHGHVLKTAGLTYAEYAHQGFGELLVVAALTLAVVAAATRWTRPAGRRDTLVVRGLLVLLCGLALVVVVSALHRLGIYEDAFGFTRLRLEARALMLWIGAILVLATSWLIVARPGWLPRAVVALTAATVLAFTLSDPDGRIARHNVERFERTGKIDALYLRGLSADAAPALAQLPPRLAACTLERTRADLARADGFAELNVARGRARDALRGEPARPGAPCT